MVQNLEANGCLHYLFRFLRLPTKKTLSSGVSWQNVKEYWQDVIYYFAFIVAGGLIALIDNNVAKQVGSIIAAVMALCLIVFLLSVTIVGLRYYLWLRSILLSGRK